MSEGIKRILIAPDVHLTQDGYVKAYELFKNFLPIYQPDITVLLGDFMDCGALSHWMEDRRRIFENRRFFKECDVARRELDYVQKHSKKTVYLEGNHECLDDKTELLTQRGWLQYPNLNLNDKVLSFNSEIQKGEWVNIDKNISYNFKGKLNRIKTDTIDLKATNDHKVFYRKRHNKQFAFTKIKNITGTRYQIPISCSFKNKDYPIDDDWIRLTAWVLTDGYITKPNGYIRISQRESKVSLITNILDRLNLKYKVGYRDRQINEICGVKVKTVQIQCEVRLPVESSRKVLEYISIDKKVPDWTINLSNRQFKIFLESLIDGDGSRHISAPDTSWMLYGKKSFLDKIQFLCLTHDYYASISTYRDKDYRLNITNRQLYNCEDKNLITKEDYDGIVWDLTVKNHNFMIRRNGKCHFTGNCWVEHYIDRHPELEGILEVAKNLQLKERGIEWVRYGDTYKLKKVYLIHGQYTNKFHAHKHLITYGCNLIYGHTHQAQVHMLNMEMQKPIMAWGLGCLCSHEPYYMKGKHANWIDQFATLEINEETGRFNVDVINITDNQFIWNGKEYK